MNKAKKLLSLTEAQMLSGLVKELIASSKELSMLWRGIDGSLNDLSETLQMPVSSDDANKVIREFNDLLTEIAEFSGKLSTLEIKLMDVRGDLQDKQERGEL